MNTAENTGLEVAVIGLAGRFPGAKNIEELWQQLRSGKELISFFSEEELKESGISEDVFGHPKYVKAKGFLEEAEYFDAKFFDYTNREANYMDPQLRLFHECVYHAIEDAGYSNEQYDGAIGLFGGAGFNPFWIANFLPELTSFSELFDVTSLNGRDYLTTRVAYKLGLTGPAITMQTACSTSLSAIHMACQSLLSGECEIALAGGVTLLFPEMQLPRKYGMLHEEGLIISPDGHCRPFDKGANGFMGGDGVGVVALKRLEDALEDGDHIYAVVKGSAINNDGRIKSGYTAPSIEGQARVIESALLVSDVSPESIGYIETHGSGTPLGDAIEVAALKQVFNYDVGNSCALGSIKSNMGHLDAAAGVAGFIKTVLALKNKQIPPTVNHSEANPEIDFEHSPFYVNTSLHDWQSDKIRRAGVSSFGIGGSNAHVILEEAPEVVSLENSDTESLIVLSAKSANSSQRMSANLLDFLKVNPDVILQDLAFTLQNGRNSYEYKTSLICSSVEEAIGELSTNSKKVKSSYSPKGESRTTVLVFSGLGSQYVNMGLELYERETVFREHMDEVFGLIQDITDINLKTILYPEHTSERQELRQFQYAQLAVFAYEYAMTQLLKSQGVRPEALIGYSFGEYTAACISGVFSLRAAIEIIHKRGELINTCGEGAMLNVPMKKPNLLPYLKAGLELAIDNGETCVISGNVSAIDQLELDLRQERVICMRIQGDRAIHSSHMEPCRAEFETFLEGISFGEKTLPLVSNVSGTWTEDEIKQPGYWIQHLSSTVEFSNGIQTLADLPNVVFIEVGPGSDITAMLPKMIQSNKEHVALNTCRPESIHLSDRKLLLSRLQKLWHLGLDLNWNSLYQGQKRKRISLPGYSFDKQRFWFKDDTTKSNQPPAVIAPEGDNQLVKHPNRQKWFYLPGWNQVAAPKLSEEVDFIANWIIFSDDSDLSKALINELKANHQKVSVVTRGDTFKSNNGVYSIDPHEESHYLELVDDLILQHQIPSKIVHLWSQDAIDLDTAPDRVIKKAIYAGFYALTGLAKSLHTRDIKGQEIKCFVLTKTVFSVTGQEQLTPIHAHVIGACKVLPIEFRNIKCLHIDLDDKTPGTGPQVMRELLTERQEHTIALRGKKTWTQTYQNEPLEPVLKGQGSRAFKHKNYLIVGGLCTRSNLGFVLAKYLSDQGAENIIFLSRTGYPPRDEWNKSDAKVDSDLMTKIKQIISIEEGGATVSTASADLTDYVSFNQAVNLLYDQFEKIDGVINVAGVMDDQAMGLISNVDSVRNFGKQFDIKVIGTNNLYKVFKNQELDFCLLNSSLTSVMGPFAAYASGNNFMDALVQKNNQKDHTPWTVINWDHLLGFDDHQEDQPLAINHEEIIDVFERIISRSELDQVVISSGDIHKRLEKTYGIIEQRKQSLSKRQGLSRWYYKPKWSVSDRVNGEGDLDFGGVMIFMKPSKINDNLLDKISRMARQVILIWEGREFRSSELEYHIDPSNSDHYKRLFSELSEKGIDINYIFHCWCSEDQSPQPNLATINGSQVSGFESLLHIGKSINHLLADHGVKVCVLTNNMQAVMNEEVLCPQKATMLGPIKILPEENSRVSMLSIDVEANEIDQSSPEAMDTLLKSMLRVVYEDNAKFQLLAHRKGQFYTQGYIQTTTEISNDRIEAFPKKGTYLLTGGLGGMSLEIVRHISEHSDESDFILLDKADFPSRDQWEDLLVARETSTDLRKKLQWLLSSESNNARIEIIRSDISDDHAIKSMVPKVLKQYQRIDGVFHIAGIIDHAGIMNTRSIAETRSVMDPKVKGALILNDLLVNKSVGFVVYFSSTGNVFSRLKFGQVAYNAGHEFIDLYAAYQRNQGQNAYVINWNDWAGTGIAYEAAKKHKAKLLDENLSFEEILSITPNEGLYALFNTLTRNEPHVILSAYDLNEIRSFINDIDVTKVAFEEGESAVMIKDRGRPELSTDYCAPENQIQVDLITIFNGIFGIEGIGIDDDFFELGGDSIKAISAISLLQRNHNLDVPVTIFFKARTARNISQYLDAGLLEDSVKTRQKINKVSNDFYEPFPLTPVQMAYLMGRSDLFEMGRISTNVYQEGEIEVDLELLNKTFNTILGRHPMMRAIFLPDGTQKFLEVDHYEIKNTDVSQLSIDEQQHVILENRERLNNHIFDEATWPLFEISVLSLSDKKRYIFFCLDHIICDANSILIFVKEWDQLLRNPSTSMPALEYTFRDYILENENQKHTDKYKLSRNYWMERVDTFPLAPNVPLKCHPSNIQKPRFKRLHTLMPPSDWKSIRQLAKSHQTTAPVLLISAYAKVLAIWSNRQDVAINLTLFNRYPFHEDVPKIVGDFTMLLMLGLKFSNDKDFMKEIDMVQQAMLESLDHRYYDGVDFIREFRKRHNLGAQAVMPFVFTSALFDQELSGSGEVEILNFWRSQRDAGKASSQSSQVYLDCTVSEMNEGLELVWDFVDDIFDEEVIQGMFDHFVGVIRHLIAGKTEFSLQLDEHQFEIVKNYGKFGNADASAPDQITLSKEDEHRILFDFNDTEATYNANQLIHELFEEQVTKHPFNTAVLFDKKEISYLELNERANQLAHQLIALGVSANTTVGLLQHRSDHLVETLLGIMKAGGVYVPLEPYLPDNRVEVILNAVACKILIISRDQYDRVLAILPQLTNLENLIVIDETPDSVTVNSSNIQVLNRSDLQHFLIENPDVSIDSLDNAYVIFTSGTTGQPKGVVVQHRPVINLIEWVTKTYDFNESDRVLFTTSVSFDLSVFDIFGLLAVGGSVYVLSSTEVQDPAIVAKELVSNEITFWDSAPQAFQQVISYMQYQAPEGNYSDLRLSFSSGDWIPLNLPSSIQSFFTNCHVVALGGATEATVWSNYFDVQIIKDDWVSIPYGKPIQNAKYYILDEDLNVCPIGVPGYLYIGGQCIAKEYYGDIELTSKKFVQNPFAENEKMYFTGDRARWFEDGNIEFLGRLDDQVKVRGYRVELGEIESHLLSHPSIKEAVAATKKHEGDNYLIAYFVSDEQIDPAELRKLLLDKMPDYMVPFYYIQMDSFPLSANGKLNKKALPEPAIEAGDDFVAPNTAIERQLGTIWSKLLGVDEELISVNHSFFELGGHSLKATLLINKINQQFSVKMPLTEIFSRDTIRQQGLFIETSDWLNKAEDDQETIAKSELII